MKTRGVLTRGVAFTIFLAALLLAAGVWGYLWWRNSARNLNDATWIRRIEKNLERSRYAL